VGGIPLTDRGEICLSETFGCDIWRPAYNELTVEGGDLIMPLHGKAEVQTNNFYHGCNVPSWLQFLSMVAMFHHGCNFYHGCNVPSWLQFLSMAAMLHEN